MNRQQQLKKVFNAVRSKDKIKELKELLSMVNDGLSRKDFTKAFKEVVNHVFKIEAKLIEKINIAIKGIEDGNSTSLEAIQADLRGLATELTQSIDNALKEQEICLNFLKDKAMSLKNGKDGKDGRDGRDADERKIADNVLSRVPNYDTDIEKLREDLKKNKRLGGGGTSAIGVRQAFKYIAHTEKPVGTINGTNKVFTVSKAIFWVAGFTISNQQIAELPNFTYEGNTITFDQAIPASYATRDFECKYIG